MESTIVFSSIILIVGLLTILSDLKNKKIYNSHLMIGFVLGLAGIVYTSIWTQEPVVFHIINGIIAFITGTFLHRISIWKGGDAKLFALYAFLMPAIEPNPLPSSVINLFACSFIAGTMVILPFLIKDTFLNYKAILRKITSPDQRKPLLTAIGITCFYSWIFFPLYYFAGFIRIPALSMLITYFIFYIVRRYIKKAPITRQTQNILIGCGIALGFLMRFWLSPSSLSWPILGYSILKIVVFSTLAAGIYIVIDFFSKQYHDRVAFAPLLFIGCVLSYTPFITWIMHLRHL